MAILDPERAMPRSALRYRPLVAADDQAVPGSRLVTHPRRKPIEPDNLEETRDRLPRQRSVAPARQISTKRRFHPLFWVGIILLATVLLWVGIDQAVAWGTNELNTIRYGAVRTFQIDEVVGGGDNALHPSHFLALNLHGNITILEFPAGDATRVRVLATTALTGPDVDQAIVTLRFVDVNHTGYPDLLIDIAGVQSVLINDQGTFRPPTTTEQQQLLQDLQHEQ